MRLMDWASIFLPEKEIYRKRKNGMLYTMSQKGGKRIFRINGSTYSALNTDSIYVGSYWDYFIPLPALYEKAKVLVIGLGIGTIPYQLTSLYGGKVSIDVIDTNSDLVALARRFLPKGKQSFRTIIGDGSEYVKKQKNMYDIIIQDAFVGLTVPAQFLSPRFMDAAHAALKKDGILAINYVSNVGHPFQYTSRLRDHFKNVYTMNPMLSGNFIIICSKTRDREQMVSAMRSKMPINGSNKYLLRAYSAMY